MKNRMIPPPTDLMKFLVSPKMEMNFFILADDHIIMCNTPFLMDTVRQQKLCKSTDPERISSRRRIVIPCPLRIEPERQAKQAMRLILGNQWAAISSRRRMVIPCHLRIEPKQAMRLILGNQRAAISPRQIIVILCQLRIEAKREERLAMRLILGNQRAAISSRRRIVIPCHLRIEPERQAKFPLASLRVDPLNVMFWKR